jgi:hypothetical protein
VNVAVQHSPRLFLSWAVTGRLVTGSGGSTSRAPLPFTCAFALPFTADGLSSTFWTPSGVRSLSLYFAFFVSAFQHGLPAHVPLAGARKFASRLGVAS